MGRADPHVWDAVLVHLRRTYPGMCRRWFDDIEPLELSGGTLRLLVREPVQLKYLQRRCQEQFTEAVQAVMRLLVAVRFVGETELKRPADAAASGHGHEIAVAAEAGAGAPARCEATSGSGAATRGAAPLSGGRAPLSPGTGAAESDP